MKIIIAGTRQFNDYQKLKQVCDKLLSKLNNIEIVSGTAKGADSLGEKYAIEHNYKLTKFPADWNKHGKAAGIIRNKQMGDYANGLIAFWDEISPGTNHMINYALEKGLKVKVYNYILEKFI